MRTFLANLPRRGLLAQVGVLWAVALAASALVTPIAASLGGIAACTASSVALSVCLAGTTLALVVSHALCGPQRALHRMLLSMTCRTAIPLAAALVCLVGVPALAGAGLLYYLLIFYPVTLAVETALSLAHGAPSRRDDAGAGPAVG